MAAKKPASPTSFSSLVALLGKPKDDPAVQALVAATGAKVDSDYVIAKKHGFSREQLDAYSLESHRRAVAATQAGAFDGEIVPIEVSLADGRTAQVWLGGAAEGPLVLVMHGCPDTRHVAMTGQGASSSAVAPAASSRSRKVTSPGSALTPGRRPGSPAGRRGGLRSARSSPRRTS